MRQADRLQEAENAQNNASTTTGLAGNAASVTLCSNQWDTCTNVSGGSLAYYRNEKYPNSTVRVCMQINLCHSERFALRETLESSFVFDLVIHQNTYSRSVHILQTASHCLLSATKKYQKLCITFCEKVSNGQRNVINSGAQTICNCARCFH